LFNRNNLLAANSAFGAAWKRPSFQ